jgi:hypothetical protein
MDESPTPSIDMPRRDFGEPVAEFRPTFGQTAAGVFILGSCTAALFACVIYETDALKRIAMGSCGVTSLCMTYWIYGLRKWRLWVCPGGVVQRRSWETDEIAWSDIREAVVERHFLTRNPDNVMLVRAGPGRNVTIKPINCGKWKQAVAAVLQGVNDRQIPVRNVAISS